MHRARPRVFIDLGKPPPDPPNIFPAESQEEICRANFTVTGFDRHDVPTVISRRETLMAATSNDNLAKDPSSPSTTGCTASLFYRIFTESPRVHRMTPRQPIPSSPSLLLLLPDHPSSTGQRYYFFHGRASAICSGRCRYRNGTVK